MDIQKREITSELQEAYLDYAMSVIVSRALPDIRDGLKPVHRRVLWAMWDSGLTHQAKFRKSANVVGETMGKYHPHGDSAIYDTLVRLAQDFSMRYPLIQGQGNFGSVDGDSAAAMRYTEARLAKISEELLGDIEKETVDWAPNYDATRTEPKVLPAKLPNLLLNGSQGIAVGMATSIPPHNLKEVVDATLYLADNPDASNNDLMDIIQGPDFPTGGIIFDRKAIKETYASGRGGIICRAKVEVEERKNRQFDLVITEIPYQVNKSELIKKIAELVQDKRVEGIRDVRDESDREGMRVVIELKNDVPPQRILNQLYRYTDLQKDFHLNMIGLVNDGLEPRLLSVKDILEAYLDYRKIVIRRRTEFDLKKAEERAHILEGLARALSAIDKVIATIKKSKNKDEAHKNLMSQFKLSDVQATAILEMRLQTLAALERQKIEDELKEKRAIIKELQLILKSPAKILAIIKKEITDLSKVYDNGRRTQVVQNGLTEVKDEDLIPQEEAVITFSSGGYIKRLPPDTFKSQKRGGKGLIGSDVGEEDFLIHFLSAATHDNILFFTDRGRVFQTKVYEIPPASRTSKGRAIHNFLELPTEENIGAIIAYPDNKKVLADSALVMVTKDGVIKKTMLDDFRNIRRTGIIAISLKKGDLLKGVKMSDGKSQIVLTTEKGQSIRFKESQVRKMGRSAAGIRAIRLKKGDQVASFDLILESEKEKGKEGRLLVIMSNGFAKQTKLKEYKVQNRGGSGIRTANITPKTGNLIAARIITEETELLALSAKGQVIRTGLDSVRTTGRSAQGVRIMTLHSGDRLAGIIVI
ncbi:MAG TPA: DNA gyrase subunit A [Candidatus Paceibacterota bacterium]